VLVPLTPRTDVGWRDPAGAGRDQPLPSAVVSGWRVPRWGHRARGRRWSGAALGPTACDGSSSQHQKPAEPSAPAGCGSVSRSTEVRGHPRGPGASYNPALASPWASRGRPRSTPLPTARMACCSELASGSRAYGPPRRRGGRCPPECRRPCRSCGDPVGEAPDQMGASRH